MTFPSDFRTSSHTSHNPSPLPLQKAHTHLFSASQSYSAPQLSAAEHKSRKDAREADQFFWQTQASAAAAFARGNYRDSALKSEWQLLREEFELFGKCSGQFDPQVASGLSESDDQLSIAHITAGIKSSPGIDFDKYDSIPVEKLPLECEMEIPSISTFPEIFTTFAMPDFVTSNVDLLGWVRPTPVQRHAIPAALVGRDLMVCAQTGSGKTAAYLLPIVSILVDENAAGYGTVRAPFQGVATPRAIILAPTRELCTQIYVEALKLTHRSFFKVVQLYGGAEPRHQLYALARGVDIVIATPGRLLDFIERGVVAVEGVQILVLDEADKMLDMGFEPQIRAVVQNTNAVLRQTLMFSATFPKAIRSLARDFCRPDFVWLAVGRVGGAAESVVQKFVKVMDEEKAEVLKAVLVATGGEAVTGGRHHRGVHHYRGDSKAEQPVAAELPKFKRTLVFVARKKTASDLCHWLWRTAGIEAAEIHGDVSQSERERALWRFRQGQVGVLIASDVASRGLDIPDVDHVINFDMANTVDDYVHRIGRTGRIGRKGWATSLFVTETDGKIARDLVSMLRDASSEVPDWLLDEAAPKRGKGSFGKKRFALNRAAHY